MAHRIVATGGIGTGVIFVLRGEATLGREESRAAQLLAATDYCKLHIVAQTLANFVSPRHEVVPVGAVGDDDAGHRLRKMISQHRMSTDEIAVDVVAPTLFAVAYLYPNGDGGNITATDSASDRVTEAAVLDAVQRRVPSVVVALPEVPLPVRAALLRAAPEGAVRVAAFTSAELAEGIGGMLGDIDVLALNSDEARVLADLGQDASIPDILGALRKTLHPVPRLLITAGDAGSWSWDGAEVHHARIPAARVSGSAGAGDAYLAGFLAAIVNDADFAEANRVGSLAGSLAVEVPDALRSDLDAALLRSRASELGLRLPVLERLRS